MSVSATKPFIVTSRNSFPHIAVAVLTALALFAILVAISVSNHSTGTRGSTAPWGAGAPALERVIPGDFRDPTSHALVPVAASSPSQDVPGPGHK